MIGSSQRCFDVSQALTRASRTPRAREPRPGWRRGRSATQRGAAPPFQTVPVRLAERLGRGVEGALHRFVERGPLHPRDKGIELLGEHVDDLGGRGVQRLVLLDGDQRGRPDCEGATGARRGLCLMARVVFCLGIA